MPKFEKELPASPWKVILFTAINVAVVAIFNQIVPSKNSLQVWVLAGFLTIGLVVAWWSFYYKMSVVEIEVNRGFVNILWKNRMGKEKQASKQPTELCFRRGTTGGKGSRPTLDLLEKSNKSLFKRPLMQIIDGTGGWNESEFTTIEKAFDAAGIERVQRIKTV
ncbi:hypothetical protein ACE38W_03645 [Chitinophaga sp. Hz27]|uniref:hypothetical protein n=1 Tax=Chitinophaga sp. Hz27 TaxID=3347169 RepID=UPI0035E14F6D